MEFKSELVDAETFRAEIGNISRAANTPLPQNEISIVGLACTSMAFCIGPDRVAVELGQDHRKTIDMASAQIAAIKAVGAQKVSLVTPYIEDVA